VVPDATGDPVRAGHGEVALQQVGAAPEAALRLVVTVPLRREIPTRPLAHQPGDPVLADLPALSTQVGQDADRAVGAPRLGVVVADPLGQLAVRDRPCAVGTGQAGVVAAAPVP
jgi:hypothetical protein